MRNKKYAVIVLSAGSGSRMKSNIAKQYMMLNDKVILSYSLDTFEKDDEISDIVIVASKDDIEMVNKDIVEKYGYKKILAVVAGGSERYESVYNGMKAIADSDKTPDYVMIHDGARPFISNEVTDRLKQAVVDNEACIPAVKSKDTIRISDDNGYVKMTPKRDNVWNVQTPQTFVYEGLKQAFDTYMTNVSSYGMVTDDAMVWELVTGKSVKIVEGDYNNIKITTPEDIAVAEGILGL